MTSGFSVNIGEKNNLVSFASRKKINDPDVTTLVFATDPGNTSPVLDRAVTASKHMEHCTGLKSWMIEFQKTMPPVPVDKLTHAMPHLAITTHLKWDVNDVNFKDRVLTASATYVYRNKVLDDEKAGSLGNDKLILDVQKLSIYSVKIDGHDVPFEIVKNPDRNDPNKFDALHITIPSNKQSGSVKIDYKTDPSASGLFWIDPKFTTNKKDPLVYTLFQANDGASVIPGQHSPQVRLTWEVNVSTGSPDLIALSSVKNNPKVKSDDGKYEGLRMDRKIPLYLLCLEVGNMEYSEYVDKEGKPTGYGVYSEPETLEETKKSFAGMPSFIAAAEKIFGPYKWGRYDASVLCNAFPYSAMEHACKSTFGRVCMGKPEIIAHEITHSWLGNDITNATWFEFYLNEGFTVFGEILICAEIWGWDYASLVMLETLGEMEKAIAEYRESRPGVLPLVSTEVEFSRIPYGKGALFFFMLRDAIGHKEFGDFVKDYMNVFYQNSMSTDRFLAFLQTWLKNERGIENFEKFKTDNKVDQWLYGMEIPENCPQFTSALMAGIEQEAQAFINNYGVNAAVYEVWTEQMKETFLGKLKGKITQEQAARLDKQLNLTNNNASLIMRNAWSQVCANVGYYTPETKEFIVRFVLERNSKHLANLISADLCKTEEGRQVAREILDRGVKEDCLFEVTRRTIADNLAKYEGI